MGADRGHVFGDCDIAAQLGWELPRHAIACMGAMRAPYAVTIPVWNEGERLTRQLARLAPYLGIADVWVADASSTDGSTDPGRLAAAGVRALVSVQGEGVGSALRPAMAHAMVDGYEGVILMDGNDKDDAEMIRTFADRLRGGADYAQGSRYIPGGRGINTPALRDVLIRLIHSPLYSLACRRRFTDSTIGSRAFSRRLLLDPRVRPFRHRFRYYDLYFYLGWKACRIGASVVDAPVTRSYPAHGPTPTKIRSPRPYWRMIAPLFGLLLGAYGDGRARRDR